MKTKAVSSIVLIVATFSILLCANCLAGVPQLINYQGVLKDSTGVPVTGDPGMEFSIWDDSIGGNRIWDETYVAVHVQNGLFNVLLGSRDPIPDSIFNAGNSWLQVQVSTSVLSPRRRIVSVGYANYAANADMVDGKHANEIGVNPSKVYDSGWFACAPHTTYTKTHNLGTTVVIMELWWSSAPDGSSNIHRVEMEFGGGNNCYSCSIEALNTTQISIVTGDFVVGYNSGGWLTGVTSGYYRLIMLALE